jgi:hypothetical protein
MTLALIRLLAGTWKTSLLTGTLHDWALSDCDSVLPRSNYDASGDLGENTWRRLRGDTECVLPRGHRVLYRGHCRHRTQTRLASRR